MLHIQGILLFLGAASAVLVPSPPGPFSVSIRSFELVDSSRIDPFAPDANTKRRFMASAYLPVDTRDCETQVVPYMPPLTASIYSKVGEDLGLPSGIIENFEMEFCNISSLAANTTRQLKKFPVAVFSPGYGGTRFVYGALARSMASLGYIVITVDHTYEAAVVEFPNGDVAYNQPSAASDSALTLGELAVRAGDVSFLVSQLANTTFTKPIFANFPGTFDPFKVAAYGHSFGGSTSLAAALDDPSIIGGLNIDGPFYGEVGDQGIKGKPFALVANGGEQVFNFTQNYPKIDAPKMDLAVKNTEHYSFTDLPLLLTSLQLPPQSQAAVEKVLGTLPGRNVEKALNQIISGWLEFLFNHRTELIHKIQANPDISVMHKDIRKCK